MERKAISRFTFHFSGIVLLFLGGLAATRIMFEYFFPRLLWLGRPFPALAVAVFTAILGWFVGLRLTLSSPRRRTMAAFTLSPLLLNLLYLFDPTVNLVQSRLIFGASLWLTAIFIARHRAPSKTWRWLGVVFVLAALLPVYLLTMPHTVGRADTFEFQVVTPQLGIAHPTGYPLYLLLGKLFTLIPAGSVAWRLNLVTAVFALTAASLLYLLGQKLQGDPLPALLGAIALGLTPTFWSQAIEAEVYSLHALIIVGALSLMQYSINNERLTMHQNLPIVHYALFIILGLGLTNHLTTVFLLPPAALTLIFAYRSKYKTSIFNLQSSFKLTLALLAPLSLYAYLPIRWAVVTGQAMGFGRFVDWVIGGRFQGALQWRAWLDDPTRYNIVGRLFLENWGWINLALALIGLIYLFTYRRKMAFILLIIWLGFTFYCLNYYVPDLAVFLIPAQIVVAVWWMAGVMAVLKVGDWRLEIGDWAFQASSLQPLVSSLILIPILLLAIQNWPQIDRSQDDGLTTWGRGVLAMPLARDAAVLADSEKIAPLYYLQQAEGMRPDLEIMVLPDEAAYRAELDGRIAAGQTVYLARFLPGLEGIYHLRSMGPLTEVSRQPMTALPATAVPINLDFDGIHLIGYELETNAAIDEMKSAVTLYWQTSHQPAAASSQHVYIHWENQAAAPGQHPANNYYPTAAWQPGEIVPDFHLLPHPISEREQHLKIQAALAPPFTPFSKLDWQTVTRVTLPPTGGMKLERPLRAQIGSALLQSSQFPAQIRPQQPLPIVISGYGTAAVDFSLSANQPDSGPEAMRKIVPLGAKTLPSFSLAREIEVKLENGRYQLIASQPNTAALCGWLAPVSAGCVLGQVEISGVALPANAINYDDQIALLSIELPQTEIQPGGQFPLTLTWQSLAPISDDYTIFIQILDANDRIVGQIDTWPLQGTYPTSQWTPGEIITDAYAVQLDSNLPPGPYRLQVGWYLLGTLRRLPVLNPDGVPIDDKLLVPGMVVP